MRRAVRAARAVRGVTSAAASMKIDRRQAIGRRLTYVSTMTITYNRRR